VTQDVSLVDLRTADGELVWVNVDGLHDIAVITTLCSALGIHPVVQEDILNTAHRTKVEVLDDHLYVVAKMVQWLPDRSSVLQEQVSLLVGRGWVLTFQERSGDVFEPVRQRLANGLGRIRNMPSTYLACALLTEIVDHGFAVLDQLGDLIDQLEVEVLGDPEKHLQKRIYELKREVTSMRRAVWPLKEAVMALLRSGSEFLDDRVKPYFHDLLDHLVDEADIIELFRENLSELLSLYLNIVSNRMNEVMKVLTIVATIFIPLTFIAGVYGMNFEYMPELAWPWAYFAALGLMAALGLGMVQLFRRRKWL
jgi:magnesium transporter